MGYSPDVQHLPAQSPSEEISRPFPFQDDDVITATDAELVSTKHNAPYFPHSPESRVHRVSENVLLKSLQSLKLEI